MDSRARGCEHGAMLDTPIARPGFPAALRAARAARRLSQLDLALDCDVSARHLSFLETGRARPSREMVIQLAEGLVLPLGARNALLQAAGYAPVFPASPLDGDALAAFRAVLDEMMARHAPNPALLCDRHWNLIDANPTAHAMLAALADGDGEVNLVRLLTTGPRAAAAIANLPEMLAEMAGRIRLEALEAGNDPVLTELLDDIEAARARYPLAQPAARHPLVPLILNSADGPLGFLSAIAHFGTSEDVTVRDLRLELLFPADAFTRTAMVALSP